MIRVLLVEDEADARQELEETIRRLCPGAKVDPVAGYADAVAAASVGAYDLIFTDLLLLPPGTRAEGPVLRSIDGTAKAMSPSDWDRYADVEGGIGFVRKLRTELGPNTMTPVVALTWFVEQDGYKRIVRRLSLDKDPRLILLPKLSRVRGLEDELPERLRDQAPPLVKRLELLINQCLTVPWDLGESEELRTLAHNLRIDYRIAKKKGDGARLGFVEMEGGPRAFQSPAPVACTLHVEIDPGGDSSSMVNLLSDPSAGSEELAHLYDDWPRLRDWVLLNPRIEVKLSLSVRLVGEERDEPQRIPLPAFLSSPESSFGSTPTDVATLSNLLIERLLLVYLAGQSEPPPQLGEGWGVTIQDLCEVATDVDHHRAMPHAEEGWGQSGIALDGVQMLVKVGQGIRVKDRLESLSHQLLEALKGYHFPHSDVLGILPENSGRYFNGNLQLDLPEECWHRPEGEEAQRMAFFVLSDDIPFACLGGRFAPAEELELRFREAGMTVERFTSLDQIEEIPARLPDATLAVVAPVDDNLLDSFISGPARELWDQALPEGHPPTILALTDGVGVRSPEEMECLRETNIDCMFPSRVPDALDLTKIIDHVICSGYRTRYAALASDEDDAAARAAARERITGVFAELFEQHGYEGDRFSGAGSERLPDGRLLITASKTDKLSTDPDDVAVVHEMDVVCNKVTWSGRNRPSSSVRWHSMIYDHLPWARCILHTHWKELTYSEGLADRATAHYRLSGSRREAAEITAVLAHGEAPAAVAVLKDHGEVFVGEDWESLLALVTETLATEGALC